MIAYGSRICFGMEVLMREEKKLYSEKIAEKISNDKEEQEILQYGLHQGFTILLNLVTLMVCGILWNELSFMLFLFLGIFFLRPYAGGYHADTELRCYFISAAIMNIAVWAKRSLILSDVILAAIWIGTAVIIWIYAPVENPIHPLDESERKKYAKNTKKILLCNGMIVLAGIGIQQQFWGEIIVWVQILTVIAMVAGLLKYKERL